MNKELREKIPVISFLMMMEVLLYHCESPSNELAVSALDLKLNTAIDNLVTGVPSLLCMSWFFAITGFLLFRNLSFQNLGSKMKTRVRTLLVPYLLWQAIYIIKSILQGNEWTLEDMFGQVFLLRIWPPLGLSGMSIPYSCLQCFSLPFYSCFSKTKKSAGVPFSR